MSSGGAVVNKGDSSGAKESKLHVNSIVAARLLSVIKEVRTASGWKVLVVDQRAVRVISFALKMRDIIEDGVTLVEKLEIERQPMKTVDAIYIMAPNEENIDRILLDFKDAKDAKYAAAHIYFTEKVPGDLLARLKTSPFFVSKVQTMRELNLHFLAVEQHAFSLDMPDYLHMMHSPVTQEAALSSCSDTLVSRLFTVCVTLSERPIIRAQKGGKSEQIARKLSVSLDEFEKLAGSNNPWYKPSRDAPSTMLLIDRARDPLSPLLHEYTYQAMINDLLPIVGDRYTYMAATGTGKEKVEKTAFLNESDPLWARLRHLHIADAINTVLDDFNKFTKESKAAHMAKGGVVDLKQMSDAIRSMPQYTELLSKYSMHIELTKRCMKLYEEQRLEEVSGLEQDMAMGMDVNGKAINKEEILPRLSEILGSGSILEADRMRLVMIFVITQEGVTDDDVSTLIKAAKFSKEEEAVKSIGNLKLLGVQYKSVPEKPSGMLTSAINKFPFIKGSAELMSGVLQVGKSNAQKVDYDLSRYRPPLQFIMQDALNDKIDTARFEAIGSTTRSAAQAVAAAAVGKQEAKRTPAKAGWATKGTGNATASAQADEADKRAGPRLLVFVTGGLGYSELRASYELSKQSNRDVVIGSTEMLDPSRYLDTLAALHTHSAAPKLDAPPQKSQEEEKSAIPPNPPSGAGAGDGGDDSLM